MQDGITSVLRSIKKFYTYRMMNRGLPNQDTYYLMRFDPANAGHNYCTDSFETWGGNSARIRSEIMQLAIEMYGNRYEEQYTTVSGSSGQVDAILNFACYWRGQANYQFGGDKLPNVDCSGFVRQVLLHYNRGSLDYEPIVLGNRTADAIMKGSVGYFFKDVSLLQKGDLVFYGASNNSNETTATHVGFYLGDGRIVHCSSAKGTVVISDLNYRTPIGFKRVVSSQ